MIPDCLHVSFICFIAYLYRQFIKFLVCTLILYFRLFKTIVWPPQASLSLEYMVAMSTLSNKIRLPTIFYHFKPWQFKYQISPKRTQICALSSFFHHFLQIGSQRGLPQEIPTVTSNRPAPNLHRTIKPNLHTSTKPRHWTRPQVLPRKPKLPQCYSAQ